MSSMDLVWLVGAWGVWSADDIVLLGRLGLWLGFLYCSDESRFVVGGSGLVGLVWWGWFDG